MFPPTQVRVGFGLDKLALGQTSLPVFQFSPINMITPAFHIS